MQNIINVTIPLIALPPLLAAFAFFSLGLFTVLHKPYSTEKALFAILCLETIHWEIAWFISFLLKNQSQIALVAKFAYLTITFLPFTFYHLIVAFLKQSQEMKYVKYYYVLAVLLILMLFSSDLFVAGHRSFEWGHFARAGLLYPVFIISSLTAMLRGVFILFRALQSPDLHPLVQNQVRFLLLGLGIYLFCALDFRQVYGFPSYPIGTLFFLLSYLVIGYAITYHQVLEPKKIVEIIQREKFVTAGFMAAGLHHDLKSPLYVAKGTVESYLAKEREGMFQDSAVQLRASQEVMLTALRQLNLMHEISRRLLDNLNPRMGHRQIENISLRVTVENVLQLIKYRIDLNDIKIHYPSEDRIFSPGHREQIEEALFNLMLNSCQAIKKSSDKGEIKITVKANDQASNVFIEDNGPGILGSELEHIFDPFYTTKKNGMGLGLYIVKNLIEKNRGKIFITSKPGEGTTVTLRFPVSK